MAEEKKPKVKRKKLFIALGVLVVIIALVCVLVVVLPQAKNAQEVLHEVASISMADNEDTKANYKTLSNKIETTAGVQYYSVEIDSIEKLIYTIDDVVDFYDEYYPLAQNVGKNIGIINGHLNNIKIFQKSMNNVLLKAKQETTDGITHLQNVWIDYRATFSGQLSEYTKLFNLFNDMYHTCLGEALVVNDASRLVLNTVDDYMEAIFKMVDNLVMTNVKGSKEADYDLGSFKAKVDSFSLFVDSYLKQDRNFIAKYYFTANEDCQILNGFFGKFSEANLESVINSIEYSSSNLVVLYTNDNVLNNDSEAANTLEKIKLFVKGGL